MRYIIYYLDNYRELYYQTYVRVETKLVLCGPESSLSESIVVVDKVDDEWVVVHEAWAEKEMILVEHLAN